MEKKPENQNQFFQKIIEAFACPCYVIDVQNYQIVAMNSAARQEGFVAGEATCYAMTHGNKAPCGSEEGHVCPLEAVKKSKNPEIVEHLHTGLDGNKRYVEVHASPILDEKNEIVQIIEYTIDITERKQAELQLRESEEKFKNLVKELSQDREAMLNIMDDLQEAKTFIERSRRDFLNIIEKSADGILIVDQKKQILFSNPQAESFFGRQAKELLATKLNFDISIDKTSEITIARQQKDEQFAELKAGNIDWEGEKAYLIMLHDITEHKQFEGKLKHAAQEWRITFDAIGSGVALLDKEGKILRCNLALKNLLGKEFYEIFGQDCHELVHIQEKEETLEKEEKETCPIALAKTNKRRETRTLAKNKKWYYLSVDPMLDKNNEFLGAVHIITDITDQKEIEEKLRAYMEFNKSIFETVQSLIVVLDQNMRIISINVFAAALLGYKQEELIGRHWLEIIPEEDKKEIEIMLKSCLSGGKVRGYELTLLVRENKRKIISWYSSELRDVEGKIAGIVIAGHDITQRKEIEKMQRLAQLGTLVSHMAHEVNNPLMVISGRAQLSLLEKIENEELKNNLNVVMKECQRAKEIIQRLLKFSRPSKGEFKERDVNKSLEEVISLVEHQFGLGNVRIKRNFDAGLPFVFIDEKQMQEVFMNLFTNAFDAMEKEGLIVVATTLEEHFVRIEVKDTGKGMPKEVMDKLFEPFFTTKQKGTGLGLSICYNIIKTHQGELKFESEPGKGTTAIILLPKIII